MVETSQFSDDGAETSRQPTDPRKTERLKKPPGPGEIQQIRFRDVREALGTHHPLQPEFELASRAGGRQDIDHILRHPHTNTVRPPLHPGSRFKKTRFPTLPPAEAEQHRQKLIYEDWNTVMARLGNGGHLPES